MTLEMCPNQVVCHRLCGWCTTQATQKRTETFTALQTSLDDLIRRMVECEERNSAIVNHLSELDNLLQEEKAKWTVNAM